MRKIIRIADGFVAAVCAVIMCFVGAGSAVLPSDLVQYNETDASISAVYTVKNAQKTEKVDLITPQTSTASLKVFGVVPVKDIRLTSKTAPQVYVSGEVFGIKLFTDGVIVVGVQGVDLGTGKKADPAGDAGIETGDIIVSINNKNVYSSGEVTSILNENNGEEYKIKVKRDGRYKTFVLKPVYSPREGCFKAGMWVRDSTAGIGTVTFYNTACGTFASLGHQINDVDTNELMPLLKGEAVSATVTRVQRGSSGATGSLWCNFGDNLIGELLDNNEYGLYGKYAAVGKSAAKYTVASKQEVKKGSAKMISTISGDIPKAYDIEIIRISYNKEAQQRDMVFKVTDKELLRLTGGIVQGMSGSPIIQNGKLIGAVTHVIVNNPEKGYAVFAQTMVEKSSQLG